MNQDRLALLSETLALLGLAAEHLAYSLTRCRDLEQKSDLTNEELERYESLTSRFARLSDLLLQKAFRLIDQWELEDEGTLRDRINRAEKKGLIESAATFIEIRELRNAITHEYEPEAMRRIYTAVMQQTPAVLDSVQRTQAYATGLLAGQGKA